MKKWAFSRTNDCLIFVSSKCRSWQAAKTIFVLAPDECAGTEQELAAFAAESGWSELAEVDGAVLILPRAARGWEQESRDRIPELYQALRQAIPSSHQGDIEMERVWMWETLVYLVGYGAGAVCAGDTVVAHPGYFAASALIDGSPACYEPGERPAEHLFTKKVSADYTVRNREIPSCVWLFSGDRVALEYFKQAAGAAETPEMGEFGGIPAQVYRNQVEPARQIRVSAEAWPDRRQQSKAIMETLFNRVIRWKNSPDGELKCYIPKDEFYSGDAFARDTVEHRGYRYDYFVRKPAGVSDTAGLPVVFSLHGRYEPSWLFATKNGWDKLCDETGAFLLVLVDSPQNKWDIQRDGPVFPEIIQRLVERYGADRQRVYLTGFSMGSACTCWAGTRYPQLFAGLSPWNGPTTGYLDDFLASGLRMPVFAVDGDNDRAPAEFFNKAAEFLEGMLQANGCTVIVAEQIHNLSFRPDCVWDGANTYTSERGYTQGERITTYVFHDAQGRAVVGYTVMKNMPHGAIYDESRAAWSFLRHFRRLESGDIEYIGD